MSDFEKEAFVKINCERKDWWVEDTWMPSAAWLEHSHYKVQVCGEEMGEKMKLGGPYTVEKGGTRDRVVVRDRQM